MDKTGIMMRGRGIACALGRSPADILRGLREIHMRTTEIPLHLTAMEYTRPYYLIDHDFQARQVDMDAFFYGVLFDTIEAALTDAELTSAQIAETTVFFGSTAADIPLYEYQYESANANGFDLFSQTSPGYGNIAAEIARRFQIQGGCHSFTTACTSSANALIYATDLLTAGRIKRALVVGYDLFSHLGFYGFESLRLIASAPYRPFDRDRAGIILGEGCGAVILENLPLWQGGFRILGGANVCDTFNVTTHLEDGDEVAAVMAAAIDAAGLDPAAIRAVKAHATGSHKNDLTEANALVKVFGPSPPPVTCLKGYMGHTVGAAGVTELIAFTEALDNGFIPATPGFKTPDDQLSICPTTHHLPVESGNFLLNFFGFGGNCTAFVVTNQP